MELTRQIENLKFSDPTNVGSFRKITIKNEKGKSLFIATGKCFSYGVKKDLRYKSTSMSLVLDDDTVKKFENIIEQCEKHLGKSISKFLYRRDDDTVTIYAKLKMAKGEILTKFCKDGKEIGPMDYEGKHREVKAVLAIEGISLNGEKLQVKIHEYMSTNMEGFLKSISDKISEIYDLDLAEEFTDIYGELVTRVNMLSKRYWKLVRTLAAIEKERDE